MLNQKENLSEEETTILAFEGDDEFADFEEEILDDLEDDIDYDEKIWEENGGSDDEIEDDFSIDEDDDKEDEGEYEELEEIDDLDDLSEIEDADDDLGGSFEDEE